jgi:hypothetical protein
VADENNVVILSAAGMTMTLRRGSGNLVGSALAKTMSPVRGQTRGETISGSGWDRRGSGGKGGGRKGSGEGQAWGAEGEGGVPSPRADVEGVRLGVESDQNRRLAEGGDFAA